MTIFLAIVIVILSIYIVINRKLTANRVNTLQATNKRLQATNLELGVNEGMLEDTIDSLQSTINLYDDILAHFDALSISYVIKLLNDAYYLNESYTSAMEADYQETQLANNEALEDYLLSANDRVQLALFADNDIYDY